MRDRCERRVMKEECRFKVSSSVLINKRNYLLDFCTFPCAILDANILSLQCFKET